MSGLSPVESRACDLIRAKEAALRDTLSHWVSIPTGHNFAPGLDQLRGLLIERLATLGAKVQMIPGDPKPDWLYGQSADGPIPPTAVCSRLDGEGPKVLIAGHLDTVFAPPPKGSFASMTVSSDGRTAIGPGVVDMKGGLLVALTALEALEEVGVRPAWTFTLNSDEETGTYHSENALRAEASRHDVGIATEPALPDGSLAVERFGSGQFIIEAFGRTAHVGRDFDKGVSATAALARAIVAATDLADSAKGWIVSIGPIRGGEATNVVPDYAAAWGNARFPTPEIGEAIGKALDGLATGAAGAPRVVVRRSFNRPAKPLTDGTRRLAELARACAEDAGQRLPFGRTGGVCDGNILQDCGLPTIDTMGVRGGGLHTTKEWIELDSLVERAQLFAITLARIAEGRLSV